MKGFGCRPGGTIRARASIFAAIRKDKPLIPVLVSRAVMPQPEALPDSLRDFAYRNAIQIDSGQDFDVHVSRLIRAMERILRTDTDNARARPGRAKARDTRRLAIRLGLVVMVGVIGYVGIVRQIEGRFRQYAAERALHEEQARLPGAAKAQQEEQARQIAAAKALVADALKNRKAPDPKGEDYAEAMRWLRMAADQGDAVAQMDIGDLYRFQWGVPQDNAEALRWFRKAADQGDARGRYLIGWLYEHGEHGSGVAPDYAEAMRWFLKAAGQEDSGAQSEIGDLYANGRGVPRDLEQARYWWRKAAANGNLSAIRALAK